MKATGNYGRLSLGRFLSIPIILAILTSAATSFAGHYVLGSWSGGSASIQQVWFGNVINTPTVHGSIQNPNEINGATWNCDLFFEVGDAYYSGNGSYDGTTVQMKFVWVPDFTGDTAPAQVIVAEDGDAYWGGDTGSCSDGASYNDTADQERDTTLGPFGNDRMAGNSNGYRGELFTPAGDGSITLSRTPQASLAYSFGDTPGIAVDWSVQIWIPNLDLNGSLPPAGTAPYPSILIGQPLSLNLDSAENLPLGSDFTCTWNLPSAASPFSSYSVASDSSSGVYNGLGSFSTDEGISSAGTLYFAIPAAPSHPDSISCTLNIQFGYATTNIWPPTPAGSTYTIQASGKLQVDGPSLTPAPLLPGIGRGTQTTGLQPNTEIGTANVHGTFFTTDDYTTYLGPSKVTDNNRSGIPQSAGCLWQNWLTTPSQYVNGTDYGKQTYVQTLTCLSGADYGSGLLLFANPTTGVDGSFPYGAGVNPYGSELGVNDASPQPNGQLTWYCTFPDSPGVGLIASPTGNGTSIPTGSYALFDDTFQTYLVYIPPGTGSCWVPIAEITWGFGIWAYNDPTAGWSVISVDPNSSVQSFTTSQKFTIWPSFPQWTAIMTGGGGPGWPPPH